MNDNKCIVCGAIIPEGRHICLTCERSNEMQTFKTHERRGKWLTNKAAFMKTCSLCNQSVDFSHDYNFCPNCGADMREGVNNGND